MQVAIINYDAGNLRSVEKAVEYCGGEAVVTNDPEDLAAAERIILPGVGAFGEGMANLRKYGLIRALDREVREKKKPFLGICLGMQLVAKKSYEFGEYQGLGWVDAEIKRFAFPGVDKLKVPHVGWNDVRIKEPFVLFNRMSPVDKTFYFVHSYYMDNKNPQDVAATCEYGIKFTAAILSGNIFATQFHPEKSQENGLGLLTEFLSWKP